MEHDHDWEEARLTALEELNILDTPPELRYDLIVERISEELNVPIVLISLLDTNRQWFKSKIGISICETPLEDSFCIKAIRSPEVTVVNDASLDPRFSDSPLVTGFPHIRFYAGAPLILPGGTAIGTLCAIDLKPRTISVIELGILSTFRDHVVAEMVKKVKESR